MDADAGRVRTALRLQAVAARVYHMDCAGFAEEVCDAVDVAGRLGYLGCLHAVVRLAAARGLDGRRRARRRQGRPLSRPIRRARRGMGGRGR